MRSSPKEEAVEKLVSLFDSVCQRTGSSLEQHERELLKESVHLLFVELESE